MDPRALHRLLAVVTRELDAVDARIELGGNPPDPERAIHAHLPGGLRVVALFDAPPERREAKQAKLDLLAETLGDLVANERPAPPSMRAPIEGALDEVLEDVRAHAHAVRALVIDDSSPVVWGTSLAPRDGTDVDAARHLADLWRRVEAASSDPSDVCARSPEELAELDGALDPKLLRELGRVAAGRAYPPELARARRLDEYAAGLAIDWVRSRWDAEARDRRFVHREGPVSAAARSFASTYRLVTVHRGSFSELHAEAALAHAVPTVEALVLRLPPVDPGRGEGRVIRLHRRKV